MGAKKKPLDVLAAADLGIDPSRVGGEHAAAQWIAAQAPPKKAAGMLIEDDDTDATVARVVAWLDERKLV